MKKVISTEPTKTNIVLRRIVLLRVLTSPAEEKWSRSIRENKKKRKESVYWQARSIAMHELEHLLDIEDRGQAWRIIDWNITMTRVISIHEYKLKNGMSSEQFEAAIDNARKQELFDLPGLIEHHFLRRIRGTRKVELTAIWIYENRDSWEKLWGKADDPIQKENYPAKWIIWEDEILAPLLAQDPDRIDYAVYEEI